MWVTGKEKNTKMGNIKFSVHRNPLKDADGNDTYQVRHETIQTVGKEYLINHLRRYDAMHADALEMGIHTLQRLIVEQLTSNNRVHIEGFGSFYLKLGFRKHADETGGKVKPHFTDPAMITGNDVVIENVGFTPDKEFLKMFKPDGQHYINATGRGRVGHSAEYTEEQIKAQLDNYFETHEYITCSIFQGYFGLTKYKAQKWLSLLTTQPEAYLIGRKIGQTVTYRRR